MTAEPGKTPRSFIFERGKGDGMRCADCPAQATDESACADCLQVARNGQGASGLLTEQPMADGLVPPVPVVDVAKADDQVTRYLCCAAQTDPLFVKQLFAHIIRQPRRSIAMSPGLDVMAVLKHACEARRRWALRDIVLTTVNLPAMVTILGCIAVAASTLSTEPLVLLPWALGIMIATSSLVTFLSELAYNRVMTGALSRDGFSENSAPEPRNPLLRKRLDEISELAAGNVTIYQGFKPFRGYGKAIGGWSFAIDIKKPASHGGDPKPFEVHDIRDYVKSQVESLEWLGLTVEDRVFVSGRDAWKDHIFIDHNGRPRPKVDEEKFQDVLSKPDMRARPYIVARLLGWDGELALTIFLRFVMVKQNLFIEASHSILTPLRTPFHKYDTTSQVSTFREYAWLVLRSIRIVTGLLSGFTHVAEFRDDRRALAKLNGNISDRNFDHGAFYSIREWASDSRYQRYFQKLDSEMYTKVVEQRIFDSLVKFLDDHGIDTGELIQRQTTILNNGVLVTGNSSITAESIAAGNGAQATTYTQGQSTAKNNGGSAKK
ncbi:hypothetical protein ACLQ2R_14600 [Streptosporangium sp. DT93]|uniref:hypothetical protein n=1 Tax=Streptosporangium sp. DT93 TaxID=3393428 RepID=UPI003CE672CA